MSKLVNKLLAELKELMIIYEEKPHYTQELQKRVYDKGVKPKSHALDNKVWLNSKYTKTEQNWKLKAKFFGLFQVLTSIRKQDYKI